MRELAALSETSPRSIRSYVAAKLLPAPEPHGKATRYVREHLLRLIVIRWLLRERRLGLPTILAELRTRSVEQLESLAVALSSDAQRTALGLSAPPQSGAIVALVPPPPMQDRHWQRLVLAPGLELFLAHDATPPVRRLASEVLEWLHPTMGSRRIPESQNLG